MPSCGPEIQRVWDENFQVYGVRKVWRQLNREGIEIARCTVARLMGDMGLAGAVRGKAMKTTTSNPAAPCPEDRVNRAFHAPRPNVLWLSDFSYVATWAGFVYVAARPLFSNQWTSALAETVIGLFKTEVIQRRGPWRSFEAVEFATLEWVDWFNNRRLLEPIGNIPPAAAEARFYAQTKDLAMVA